MFPGSGPARSAMKELGFTSVRQPSDIRNADRRLFTALNTGSEAVATEWIDFSRTAHTSQTVRCSCTELEISCLNTVDHTAQSMRR